MTTATATCPSNRYRPVPRTCKVLIRSTRRDNKQPDGVWDTGLSLASANRICATFRRRNPRADIKLVVA
jgi:hypothetical protein